MRTVLFSFLSLFTGFLTAQQQFTAANFEAQALVYVPGQRAGVSDKNFEFGTMVLRETVRQTDNDPQAFNRADYFNVLIALTTLKESDQDIHLAWEKFLASEGSCEYLIDADLKKMFFGKEKPLFFLKEWAKAEAECADNGTNSASDFTPGQYAEANGLDPKLIQQIANIHNADQRYRRGNYSASKQKPIDRKNVSEIDKLFKKHGTYLGTSLVGEFYNTVMWSVIQHSTLTTMEYYLPVVHDAVKAGELPETPLRMLIDRIQTGKTGKQVFGSQVGVPLLPEAERKQIEQQYDIN